MLSKGNPFGVKGGKGVRLVLLLTDDVSDSSLQVDLREGDEEPKNKLLNPMVPSIV